MTQPSQPETTSSIAIQPPTWVWDTANADDQPDEDDDLDDWCTSQALKQIIAAEQAGFAAIAAAQEQLQCTPPPDLEDFGTIKDRLAQPKHATLTVTQLAACEVCQQQLAYRWSTDRPEPENEAMRQGRHVHETLELEASIPDAVEIPVHTREDAFVARLIDTHCKLAALPALGRVREVWVAAKLQGMWVTGVVDEVQWMQDEHMGRVVDDKTRRFAGSLPDQKRQAGTRLQVSLYRAMFHAMQRGAHPDAPQLLQLATMRNLDIHLPLSQDLVALLPVEVLQQVPVLHNTPVVIDQSIVTNRPLNSTPIPKDPVNSTPIPKDPVNNNPDNPVTNTQVVNDTENPVTNTTDTHPVPQHTTPHHDLSLAALLPILQRHLAAIVPPMSDILHVRYLLRATGEVFACTQVHHDPRWLQQRLAVHGAFLKGLLAPECASERAVCFHCHFWNDCRAGRVVLGYPAEKPLL